ncbi:hypothetical protein NX059_009974 [Plenodomus lindquistii]|nr:hypothetical protein NX059_009974 [Plenodomus lindquistii]
MRPSTLFTPLLATSTLAASCEREYLASFTSLYLSAQTLGTPSLLTNTTSQIFSNLTYTENFLPANISSPTSILSTPLTITSSRSFLDPDTCSAFMQIIVTNTTHPYVIGVRTESDGKAVTKIESLVSDAGDWAFNATGTAYWDSLEIWDVIPAEQRDTREVIQAAGDGYFDRFGNASVVVPFGTSCARLEGGAYTDPQRSNTSTCALGLPSTINVVDRRYVVDVEMGTVNIYVGFPGLDRASKDPAPDSHTFRVEKGKLRYIHTISTCDGHPGCGLNGTYVPLRH